MGVAVQALLLHHALHLRPVHAVSVRDEVDGVRADPLHHPAPRLRARLSPPPPVPAHIQRESRGAFTAQPVCGENPQCERISRSSRSTALAAGIRRGPYIRNSAAFCQHRRQPTLGVAGQRGARSQSGGNYQMGRELNLGPLNLEAGVFTRLTKTTGCSCVININQVSCSHTLLGQSNKRRGSSYAISCFSSDAASPYCPHCLRRLPNVDVYIISIRRAMRGLEVELEGL